MKVFEARGAVGVGRGQRWERAGDGAGAADGAFDWKHDPPLPETEEDPRDIASLAASALLARTPLPQIGKEIYGLAGSYRVDLKRLAMLADCLTEDEILTLKALPGFADPPALMDRLGDDERARRVLVAAVLSKALTGSQEMPTPPANIEQPPRPVQKTEPVDRTTRDEEADPDAGIRIPVSELRAFVERKRETLAHSNNYQVLEVKRDADAETIEEHYMGLLRRYHPDNYFHDMDNATKNTLEEIFVRINTAYARLSDPNKRAKYDRDLTAGDAIHGEPTEEDLVLGKTQLLAAVEKFESGDWMAARKILQSARRLNPDSGEILGYLGRSYLEGGQANRMPDRAQELIESALDLDPDCAILYTFLGDYYLFRKDETEAAALYSQALKLDPAQLAAKKALKTLSGKAHASQGGLLGSLFRGKT